MADDGILVWRTLHEIANKVCKQYGLTYSRIEPSTNLRYHKYGQCFPCLRCSTKDDNGTGVELANCSEKIIKIRIHQIHRPDRALSLRTIIDTLAHELAHLRPDCWDHSRTHDSFRREILAFVKASGYSW